MLALYPRLQLRKLSRSGRIFPPDFISRAAIARIRCGPAIARLMISVASSVLMNNFTFPSGIMRFLSSLPAVSVLMHSKVASERAAVGLAPSAGATLAGPLTATRDAPLTKPGSPTRGSSAKTTP